MAHTVLTRQVLGAGYRMVYRCIHRASCMFSDSPPPKPITSTSYVHGAGQLPLTNKLMQQCLAETTNRIPDQEAVVFVRDSIRKTFSQLSKDVETLAAGLLALGLKKGDRLGMWAPNCYEWILIQMATAQAGIVLVSVNPAYQPKELEFVIKKVGCSALVFPSKFKTQRYYEILRQICPELETSPAGGIKSKNLPDLRTVIVLDEKLPGSFLFQDVMEAGSSTFVQQLHDMQKLMSCDDPINIQFTSGVRIALPAPLYHCLGSVIGSLVMTIYGTTLIFPSPTFEAKAVLQAISKEKCTGVYGTPTMYIDLLGQPDFDAHTSSLIFGVIGGSPIPLDVMKKIVLETNMKNSVILYGTTENSPVTFSGSPHDEIMRKMNTVGYVMPHTEAKVVDSNTGLIVPLNTPGELLIRGYCVMLRYWNDPEKTKETITPENWYKTGDVVTMDEFGYCRIVGRCKDMIIRGGENIYPAEIEHLLHTHPKIMEAQVIGVKDKRMGEELCACIRLRGNEPCTVEEIKQYCKGKISHFKIPNYIVFVEEYPLTVSGKTQKFKLREQMEKHLNL